MDNNHIEIYTFSTEVFYDSERTEEETKNMLSSLDICLDYIASRKTSWRVLIFGEQNRDNYDLVLNIFDNHELHREDRQDYMQKAYYQGLALLYFP